MSGGTFNVSRELWDDPTFRDSEMSQREAWLWMIAEASWRPRTRNVGSKEIVTHRGQLVASTRFMARAWMWSEPRVRRYLDMLKNRRMVECVTDAGITLITICNYEKYQNGPRVADAPYEGKPTHQRRTSDANEKKGEIREDKEEEVETRARADDAADPPPDDEFEDPFEPPPEPKPPARLVDPDCPDALAERLCHLYGFDRGKRPSRWMPPAAGVEIANLLRDTRASPADLIAVAKANLTEFGRPPDGPLALRRGLERLSAARNRPAQEIPDDQPSRSATVHPHPAAPGRGGSGSSITDAAARAYARRVGGDS